MRAVVYGGSDDVGGVGYRTATALNRYRPDWQVHAYRPHPSYLQFPEHTRWNWNRIAREWSTAEVTHSHDFRADIAGRKANIVTYHGTGFREKPDWHLEHAGDARVLVSTLDLWLQKPDDTTWCPQMDDLDDLASRRVPHDGPLRICHAPTNRATKSTAEFLKACEGLPVEPVLIEGRSWADALTIKGTCDILFDQTGVGYGGNAIEAWAMSIPVICGAQPPTLDEYERRFGYIPFVNTTASTIRAALEQLLEDTERTKYATLGRAHAERFHSQEAGVTTLAPIYEAASH